MFWLITITSTILVIVILLLPAIKMRDYEKITDSQQENEIRKLKDKINFYKVICFLFVIPIVSFGIYVLVGLPDSLQITNQTISANTNAQFNAGKHAEEIEQVLKQDPDNPNLLEQMTKFTWFVEIMKKPWSLLVRESKQAQTIAMH